LKPQTEAAQRLEGARPDCHSLPMSSLPSAAARYEEGFARWSEEQALALREASRSGTNLPLDWENLAEEVESLGRSLRYELHSRIATIIEHLLKLQFSPALAPRAGWADTVDRERSRIERLLEDNPSLRPDVAAAVTAEVPRAVRLAARSLDRHAETSAAALARLTEAAHYTPDKVLGDWFPDSSENA
jgi:Domain of unknown function DUF29